MARALNADFVAAAVASPCTYTLPHLIPRHPPHETGTRLGFVDSSSSVWYVVDTGVSGIACAPGHWTRILDKAANHSSVAVIQNVYIKMQHLESAISFSAGSQPAIEVGVMPSKLANLMPSDQHEWRRVRDSNPRYPSGYAGFQDRCHQPLGHLSAGSTPVYQQPIK